MTQEKYAELIALTQLYLLQEYALDKRIPAEPASYEYFKQYALRQRQQGQAPLPVQTQRPASPPPSPPIPERLPSPVKAPPPQSASAIQPVLAAPIIPQPPKTDTGPAVAPSPKIEPPSATKSTEKKKPNKLLELQPMEPHAGSDFTEMRTLVREHFPSQMLLETIPDDALAKQLLSGWKQQAQTPAVMVLIFNEPDKQLNFIKNVTKAIQLCLAPAQMISAEKLEHGKEWDARLQFPGLRLILSSDYGIYALPELMKHYREDSRTAKRYLGKVPLLLLPDISVYLKEPSLKPSLWRALCEILSPR